MANLTLVVDDALLQQARVKALQQGTSVNAICREAIARFVGEREDRAHEAVAALRGLARRTRPASDGAPAWTGRDAIYDDLLHERSSRSGRR